MRFTLFALLVALFATFAMAVAPQRSVIISWPNNTPDEIVEQSKEAIRKAKGETPLPLRIHDICDIVTALQDNAMYAQQARDMC
jgi:hypothetical protein